MFSVLLIGRMMFAWFSPMMLHLPLARKMGDENEDVGIVLAR
jgi:hypothetical protein